jgi:hypothetical protein
LKIFLSPFLQGNSPELQRIWLSQIIPWTKFFKKEADRVVQGGKKRRVKIQQLARREIDRTIAVFNPQAKPPHHRPTVCQKGCAHCCYFNVEINVLEAERLADLLRQMPDDRREQVMRRLEAASEAYRQADQRASIYRHPCPFLDGTECSIYEDRPLNCRSHVSTDVAFCIAELNTTKEILSPEEPGVTPEALLGNVMWHIRHRVV